MDKKKSIEALQFFVTHLAEGAMVHKQQGMIFKAQGIIKLGVKDEEEDLFWSQCASSSRRLARRTGCCCNCKTP